MSPATAQEIEEVLGELEPLAIERLVDTHATIDEIGEALAALEDERRFGDVHEPTSPRVREVREILEGLGSEDDEAAYVS
jgi:hypothetical protein